MNKKNDLTSSAIIALLMVILFSFMNEWESVTMSMCMLIVISRWKAKDKDKENNNG